MALSLLRRKFYLIAVLSPLILALLTACGGGDISTSSPAATPAQSKVSPTEAEVAVTRLITFVGQPTAKIVAGTTFEVDGAVRNGDSKQHDIYLQAALLDASGKTIATTAITNVDNVPGNGTENFALKGTTPQPNWASVKVTIQKVTENIAGSGSD